MNHILNRHVDLDPDASIGSTSTVGAEPAGARPGTAVIDPFAEKVEEWVDRSRGHVRADVCTSG